MANTEHEVEEAQTLVDMSFQIVASAGYARSLAFEALKKARERDFAGAHDLLAQSQNASLEAHNAQTRLITQEAAGEKLDVSLIVVHAQDHLMTALLAQELVAEIIDLREEIFNPFQPGEES
jgi:PTS system cellobiose-specific IIA component